MYRFAFRPSWVIRHLAVLALVVAMVNLGLWQLRRLDEKQARNEEIRARAALVAVSVDGASDARAAVSAGRVLRFTPVVDQGTYLADAEVYFTQRNLDGRPGFEVLTPLLLDDGTVIVVDRGWVPFLVAVDGADVDAPPPTGRVTVSGLLREHGGTARVGGDERVTVNHVDLVWFDETLAEDVHPVWLQLEGQDPPPGELPVPLDPPDLSEGPHLSYAVQWFVFASIGVVGYPLLVRRISASEHPPTVESVEPV